MRLFLGPSDLIHAASTVREGVSGAVDDVVDLFELLGRGADLMGRAEEAMTRAEILLDRAEIVLIEVESATAGAADTVSAAAAATAGAGDTVAAAAMATAGAAELVVEGRALTAPLRPLADKALPIASSVVDSISAEEAQAVVRAVDRMPQLVDSLEQDVIPMLGRLDKVGPDVHAILEAVSELAHAINGLPGMSLLQRRGERKDDVEE